MLGFALDQLPDRLEVALLDQAAPVELGEGLLHDDEGDEEQDQEDDR